MFTDQQGRILHFVVGLYEQTNKEVN